MKFKKKSIIHLFLFLIMTLSLRAQDKGKIKFQYKKFEKFDFEDLVIEGETSSPSDLTISPRYNKKFKNLLPYRKNFNLEIKKTIERIR